MKTLAAVATLLIPLLVSTDSIFRAIVHSIAQPQDKHAHMIWNIFIPDEFDFEQVNKFTQKKIPLENEHTCGRTCYCMMLSDNKLIKEDLEKNESQF